MRKMGILGVELRPVEKNETVKVLADEYIYRVSQKKVHNRIF